MNEINRFKKLISDFSYGIKTEKGIRPSINKESIKKGFKKPITNKLLKKHLENKDTVYFFGNEKYTENQTIVMIDIDVDKKQKKGSSKGALDFANHINNNIFKIYFEPSTNGKGIHGYFILNKQGFSVKEINETLKYFENFLQKEAEKINANIELVEIKGTLFDIEYENKKVKKVKYGMLGKIPRNINNFLTHNSQVDLIKIKDKFSIEKINKNKKGSISEKLFSEDELNNLKLYEKIGEDLLEDQKVKANKFLITKVDFSILIMILIFTKNNKNNDNTTPTKRIEKLWKAIYNSGDVLRGWNHHRYRIMRNILSKKGLIEWYDNRYQIGNNKTEGIACKWEISNKMYMYIEKTVKKKRSSFVDTKPQEKTEKTSNESIFHNIEDIMHEFSFKIPILSLILKENNDLMHSNAYDYINKKFCSV